MGFVALWLFCTLIPAFSGGSLPVPVKAALADEEDDEDEPGDWEDPDDPYSVDWENIPFRLVNTPGKEPGIDRESEWSLVLKPEWEDQTLPDRVQKMFLRLDAMDLNWKDNLSHVWKKEYQGLPDKMTCTGLKVAGYYLLTAVVYYSDDTAQDIVTPFTVQGPGKELIMNVIRQAAEECKTSDEWQTALRLYNWLLNHLTYDETLSYYSAEAILRGTGVCDSYARLYLLLCRAAGLVSIGPKAFANCKGLWNIRISSDVQVIAEDAFDGCGEFCIWTEHRDSLPVRYATEHGITVFVDDEEQGSNG